MWDPWIGLTCVVACLIALCGGLTRVWERSQRTTEDWRSEGNGPPER